jgi:hypothetical protein
MVWCPYTGVETPLSECTAEHIVPLSLGGSDGFTVMVNAAVNARVGSEIDAALSTRDFLTAFRRRHFDARGHSNKAAEVKVRHAAYGPDSRPAQVTLKGAEGTRVWDARDRREVPEQELVGQEIQLNFTVQPFDRIRFVAKVALSAGYAIYNDLFRNTADHTAVRALMNAESAQEAKAVLTNSALRGQFELLPVSGNDLIAVQRDMALSATVGGSVVMAAPTAASVVFIVGILGQWVGMLNVPATTGQYPSGGDHDLGHVVLLVEGTTEHLAFREFLGRAVNTITDSSVPPEASDN